jgi:two-component system nitrogen regulation sensor histidine kinase NtrY
MVCKKFHIRIVTKIIVMALTCMLLFYVWWLPGMLYLKLALMLIFILQIYLLIRFLEKTNYKLTSFFDSIKTDDFSIVYSNHADESGFGNLNQQLQELSQYFRKIRIESEQQNLYFKAVIEHVGIGIFAFDENGKIKFANSATLNLFGLYVLKDIKVLDKIQQGLSVQILSLMPEKQQLIEFKKENENQQITAKATKYKIGNEHLNIVSLQNIKHELERKETQTWQKIIRILTHEIMNSVSPITSLAASLSALVKKEDQKTDNEQEEKNRGKLSKGLSTIKNRSEGMLDFVKKYRKLTILPQPQISKIKLQELFNEIKILFDDQIQSEKISFTIKINPESLFLHVDREQIEQVMINLVKNAFWAINSSLKKEIGLHAFLQENGGVIIEVSDSGIGIDAEILNQIFIPFFTTRDEGSGIGLSLSRQIMLMHGGSISVRSKPNEGSVFTLLFYA